MLLPNAQLLDEGTLSFTIESRVLRELGERLVRQPEVALIELVKNSYDADATECRVDFAPHRALVVTDNGAGMTLEQFTNGWMRIGTSSKEALRLSPRYLRAITGEKGIGRFAVRFLGRKLELISVADDATRGTRTRLRAVFDWPQFDKHEDLGKVEVPYTLEAVGDDETKGTRLSVSALRSEANRLDLKTVRTASLGILTPLRSLFRTAMGGGDPDAAEDLLGEVDPGFLLVIDTPNEEEALDVAAAVLEGFVLRAEVSLKDDSLTLNVFRRGTSTPYVSVKDTYSNELGKLYADIRFFPRRSGTFINLPVDGRLAQSWIVDNHGVAVFDRNFRVQPYGSKEDDWLLLQADAARNRREPRSTISDRHFSMSDAVRRSTSENWMLRLPQSAQLVGLVQVEGRRNQELHTDDSDGLVAAADREGFVENQAFSQLVNLIRGAVEAIAFADRKLQHETEEAARVENLAKLRQTTQTAISEVRANPNIAPPDKARIVAALAETQQLAERQEDSARERERQLEVMSLLGVVAGFMTHEFGVALQELEETHRELSVLAEQEAKFLPVAKRFDEHIRQLKDFVTYSSGYIQGAKSTPDKRYPVRPRLLQVRRVFGKYADDRNIAVEVMAEPDLLAPLVPVSLYNGLALNLYTNALKAVTSKVSKEQGVIAFRAWNEGKWHNLEVSDSGVGVPDALQQRVFDPLFSTTQSQNNPLGSGMGLGLALVRRGAEAFGGRVDFVEAPPGFVTCIRVKLPLPEGG